MAYYGDPEKAIELYVGNEYIQHNPDVEDGKKGFIEYFTRMQKDYKDKILNSFVSQIVNKKKPLISKNEILDSMNVCLLSEKSLKSKKWEKVL